ncbi:L-xylulose 5-phosphate 3-epimerase [Escherichia coli]|uniref:L-xylulose 5-phosphate 3-epimerase n=1 Tax=Escherichia coli TaxID=562 RepID=A0A377BU81_ECOLX|nr:L-xylulose 5-phosphate 3-epimerase [Escherichia coli]
MRNHPLGIYEKALAKDLSWPERLVLAKSCGFDFVEMSVDETDERLSRLDWSAAQRTSLVAAMIETGVGIPSMCLSAHRRFPFGSRDEAVRERAREIMSKAIRLARDLGIRTIQLAGYDVYYEDHDEGTRQRFAEGLAWGSRTGGGITSNAGGGDYGYRVYELHQQMEKMGRDARLAVVHRLPGRRQPQRLGQ